MASAVYRVVFSQPILVKYWLNCNEGSGSTQAHRLRHNTVRGWMQMVWKCYSHFFFCFSCPQLPCTHTAMVRVIGEKSESIALKRSQYASNEAPTASETPLSNGRTGRGWDCPRLYNSLRQDHKDAQKSRSSWRCSHHINTHRFKCASCSSFLKITVIH